MHRSDGYICLFLGTLTLAAASIYTSTAPVQTSNHPSFPVLAATSALLYLAALAALSCAAAEQARLRAKFRRHNGRLRPFQVVPSAIATFVARATGVVAGAYVLALPLALPAQDPIAHTVFRIPTFFLGLKLLDLALVRAGSSPPQLLRAPAVGPGGRGGSGGAGEGREGGSSSSKDDGPEPHYHHHHHHATYIWRLLTENRYASFDTAVDESRRRTLPPPGAAATYAPLALLPLARLLPLAELQVLAGLAAVQLGLQALHALLHPRCRRPLFRQPFASRGLLEFWACRWHQAARPFLHGLGYAPARAVVSGILGPGGEGEEVGRAAGVLGAFGLSGVWHAWCGMSLARGEHVWAVTAGLWGWFVLQGVGCLVERRLLREERWRTGWGRRMLTVACWVWSVESASMWLRYALPRSKAL